MLLYFSIEFFQQTQSFNSRPINFYYQEVAFKNLKEKASYANLTRSDTLTVVHSGTWFGWPNGAPGGKISIQKKK